MKKRAFILFTFLSVTSISFTAERKDPLRYVPSEKGIIKDVGRVEDRCKAECTQFFKRNCLKQCKEFEYKRLELFYLRLYTDSCRGAFVNTNHNFDGPKTEQEAELEVMRTQQAFQAISESSRVVRCVKRQMEEHTRRVNALFNARMSEIEQTRKEHPVLTRMVDFVSRMRR
jgi:hypothetical protein